MRHSFSMEHALASGKLNAPTAHGDQIARQELCEQICRPDGPKVVVARGPAGYGKTTLLAQCQARLQALPMRTAWLTLDRADNDLSRFLRCLTAALGALSGRVSLRPDAHDSEDTLALALVPRRREHPLLRDRLQADHRRRGRARLSPPPPSPSALVQACSAAASIRRRLSESPS